MTKARISTSCSPAFTQPRPDNRRRPPSRATRRESPVHRPFGRQSADQMARMRHKRRTEEQPCNPRPEACQPMENRHGEAALASSATQRLQDPLVPHQPWPSRVAHPAVKQWRTHSKAAQAAMSAGPHEVARQGQRQPVLRFPDDIVQRCRPCVPRACGRRPMSVYRGLEWPSDGQRCPAEPPETASALHHRLR